MVRPKAGNGGIWAVAMLTVAAAAAIGVAVLRPGLWGQLMASATRGSAPPAASSAAAAAPLPTTGSLKVDGSQPGVSLYLDGKEVGPLPQEVRGLSPGDHTVKIAASDRYEPLEKHVLIEKDEILDLGTVTLKVVKGKATFNPGTPGVRAYLVSGSDRRELPTLPISVDIDTTKVWSIEASKPGFYDFKQTISFDDGKAEKAFTLSLEPKPAGTPAAYARPAAREPAAAAAPAPAAEAFLNINSIPPSTCFLDGRSLGTTPKVHVSVRPGTHVVKFVDADQGLSKTVTVRVGPGETKPAVAMLQ